MANDKIDLTGKVAIVTGASRGIGRAISLELAARGAAVVGTARTLDASPGTGGTLKGTMADVEALGARALALTDDITTLEGAKAVVGQVLALTGRVDMLVNNAGIFPASRIVDYDPANWAELMAINVTAPFLMCQAVLPSMMAQRSGNILNMSSGASYLYRPERVAYSTSKAAIDRFSINLAEEVREYGIAVNAWMPGLTATDMTDYTPRGVDPAEVKESAVWALAQDAATFTGQVVLRTEFGTTWGPGV